MKLLKAAVAAALISLPTAGWSQALVPTKNYTEEWVFRIERGHQEEWWQIFQKYQLGELDALKRSGDVVSYSVYRANLHMDEAARWDYRVIVVFKEFNTVSTLLQREDQLVLQLFPDVATRKAAEMRRWDLTLNHWDLPIAEIDPHK